MFKFFFMLVAVTTMISMGLIGKMGKVGPAASQSITPAPMMINANGAISFPERIPSPDTVYKIRRALQTEDVETLNALLAENRLFVAPNN